MDNEENVMTELGNLIHEKLPSDMQFALLVYDKKENEKENNTILYVSDSDRQFTMNIMTIFIEKNLNELFDRKDIDNE